MGMFDFIADVGEKLFTSDDDAAEKIHKQLTQGMPGMISDLKVDFDDGVVTLAGECDTARSKRVATLTAGNNKGVKAVNADAMLVRAAAAPAAVAAAAPAAATAEDEPGEYYTIKSGDTLGGIAKKHLGNAMAYKKICEANREVIKDPDKIYPGQKIFIPKD